MIDDPNKLIRTVTLNASPEQVWHALTSPEETRKYMFNCEVSSPWTVGSEIRWKGNYNGYESGERGVILELEKNKRLKYSSIDPNFGIEVKPENYLHITYDLASSGSGTALTTTVESFNNDPKRMVHLAAGWNNIVLPALVALFAAK